jgi:hypothetical protein
MVQCSRTAREQAGALVVALVVALLVAQHNRSHLGQQQVGLRPLSGRSHEIAHGSHDLGEPYVPGCFPAFGRHGFMSVIQGCGDCLRSGSQHTSAARWQSIQMLFHCSLQGPRAQCTLQNLAWNVDMYQC